MKLNIQSILLAIAASGAMGAMGASFAQPQPAPQPPSTPIQGQEPGLDASRPSMGQPNADESPGKRSGGGSLGSSPGSPVFVSTPEDSNSKVIANWTIVLCVFTGVMAVLAIIQAMLLRQQGKDVSLSASAAKQSADIAMSALTKMERPLVYASLQTVPPKPAEHPDVVVFNFGRSPAMLQVISCRGEDLSVGQAPAQQLPLSQQKRLPYGTVVLNPVSHHEASSFFAAPNPAPGTERWFHGNVVYLDMLEAKFRLSFAFKWDGAAGQWKRHATMNGLTTL